MVAREHVTVAPPSLREFGGLRQDARGRLDQITQMAETVNEAPHQRPVVLATYQWKSRMQCPSERRTPKLCNLVGDNASPRTLSANARVVIIIVHPRWYA